MNASALKERSNFLGEEKNDANKGLWKGNEKLVVFVSNHWIA